MRGLLAFAVLFAAAFQSVSAQTAAETSAAPLEGLWLAEVSQPVLRGELTITHHGNAWAATIGDRHVDVTAHGAELSFALREQGSFRGDRYRFP